MNHHNYCSKNYLHWVKTAHPQDYPRNTVWAGIHEESITGPYIFSEIINVETSLNNILEGFCNYHTDTLKFSFQQDGAPPHFTHSVRQWLHGNVQWQVTRMPRLCEMAVPKF
jgi:hypothetical protein